MVGGQYPIGSGSSPVYKNPCSTCQPTLWVSADHCWRHSQGKTGAFFNEHADGVTKSMPVSLRKNHKTDVGANSRRIEVELTHAAPHAEDVFVAGDFNRWHPADLRLRRDESGSWKVQLWLALGRYEYRFIVDGEWQDDPHASIRVPNEFGSSNCVLEVK